MFRHPAAGMSLGKNAMKTALVTGANKGIGREVARQLAAKRFHVFIGARNDNAGRKTAAALAESGALPKFAVNSVCPGWVRTDMGGQSATRSVEEGADTIVWLAVDAPRELTGKFLRDRKSLPW
jgi:NAD(P)-dependent dehydrogenase (short-subunit alcohol dehydrogenase family)